MHGFGGARLLGIQMIAFEGCNLGSAGVAAAISELAGIPQLTSLDLSGNKANAPKALSEVPHLQLSAVCDLLGPFRRCQLCQCFAFWTSQGTGCLKD